MNNLTSPLLVNRLSPELKKLVKSRISTALSAVTSIPFPKAVIWGGGWKYGEITVSEGKILSDIDLFVVSNWLPFYWRRLKKLEENLNKTNTLPVHFQGVIPWMLNHSRTLWAYRLKTDGVILCGQPEVLERIRATADNIPQVEAVRTLFQSVVSRVLLFKARKYDRDQEPHQAARTYLTIGEVYLMFFGRLTPSYTARRKAIGELAHEIGIDPELLRKIQVGYEVKMNFVALKQQNDLNINQAEQDCWTALADIMTRYLQSTSPFEEQLLLLERQFAPRYLFNLMFYIQLQRQLLLRPKLWTLLTGWRVTDLFKLAYYHHFKQVARRDQLMRRYFAPIEFNDDTLVQLFELWPVPATVEI